jgi:hypothetical protein
MDDVASRASLAGPGFALCLALSAANAHADEPRLRLAWNAPAGCASEEAVIAEVQKILAGPPSQGATAKADVEPVAERRFRERLSTDVAGVSGEQTLEADSCEELAKATGLILAWSIDPQRAAARAAASTPTPTPTPTATATATPTPTPTPTATPTADVSTNRSSRRTLGFLLGGLGVAGVLVGSGFGVAALDLNSSSKRNCQPPTGSAAACGNDMAGQHALLDANISDVAFGVGVVGLALGTYFILTAPPKASRRAWVSPSPSGRGGMVGLGGAW